MFLKSSGLFFVCSYSCRGGLSVTFIQVKSQHSSTWLGGKTYGGCLPDSSQMPPRCLPDGSQMTLRWFLFYDSFSNDPYMIPPPWLLLYASSSPMNPLPWFLLHDSSSMIPLPWVLYHSSSMTPHPWLLLHDSSSMTLPPWFLFYDFSTYMIPLLVIIKTSVWGLTLGSFNLDPSKYLLGPKIEYQWYHGWRRSA